MTTNESNRPLERDRPHLVFRNNRLLIGWHIAGALKTEAWLGEISQEEAIKDHTRNDRTGTLANRLRVYTSSRGLVEIAMGVMAIMEAHPAMFCSHADQIVGSSFSELGLAERLKLVASKLHSAKTEQVADHERAGRELETFGVTEATTPTGSASSSSERSVHQSTTDNDDTDPTLGSDFEMVGGHASSSEQSVHQLTTDNDDVYETFRSDFERMGRDTSSSEAMTESVEHEGVESTGGPRSERMDSDTSPQEESTHSVEYEEGVEPMERYTLRQYATVIRAEVILQATALAGPAMVCNIHLGNYLPALVLAESIYDIVQLGREVLVRMDAYRAELGNEFESQVQTLEDAEARKMPNSILARHRETVMEYNRYEYDTRTVYMNLKIQIEDIDTRRIMERYGASSPLDRYMGEE